MSSTNRGYDRHKADYYATPQKYIREFLTRFIRNENITNPSGLEWLDPCAGGDNNNQAAYVSVIEKDFSPSLMSMDIREDSHAKVIRDFLELGGVKHPIRYCDFKSPFLPCGRIHQAIIKSVQRWWLRHHASPSQFLWFRQTKKPFRYFYAEQLLCASKPY